METVRSETSVKFYQATRRYNPEEAIFMRAAVRTSDPTNEVVIAPLQVAAVFLKSVANKPLMLPVTLSGTVPVCFREVPK
jgi:hypothetical protein